ncbi:MAG TPA: DUF4492 domain-containing protein [Bacteroidales bacterium]|nr:DUF4492 domain-containing protein [Bacteroidales bacterium]
MSNMNRVFSYIRQGFIFYIDGFRNMTWWGRKMWLIILIKLFIIFAILKLFFFPDFLKQKYHSEREKSEYVMDQLINPPHIND